MSWGKLEVGSALSQLVNVHFRRRNKGGKDMVWVRRDLVKENDGKTKREVKNVRITCDKQFQCTSGCT